MACANFTITTPIGLTGAFRPVLGCKTTSPPNSFRFGSFSHTCHCHGYAFSCKRCLIFLTDELNNDRYLVGTGAALTVFPCNKNSSPPGLAPFSKGQMGNPSPLGVLLKKLCNSKANFLPQPFCKPLRSAPFWALTF